MSMTQRLAWTRDAFLDWAGAQEQRYEFDGFRPQAMTGGTARHNRIAHNLYAALRLRLNGTPCSYFGPDLGVDTIGDAVRYPDALITCTRFRDTARLAPDPVAVFEVVSPTSARMDRIVKLREYQAVASIQCYVIVESGFAGAHALLRQPAGHWRTEPLGEDDTLRLPHPDIAIPLAELFADIDFAAEDAGG